MAFNPFSWFRDNQKGVMIGLIGLCMVIFIFQFGPGDAFTRWLNVGGRASGEVVTTLHGKKVRESDLSKTAGQRKLASDFLFTTVQKGQREVAKELSERMQEEAKKKTSDLKEIPAFAGLQTTLMMYNEINDMITRPDRRMQPQQLQQFVRGYLQQMGSTLRTLESSAAKPDLDAEARAVYRQVATLLGFQRNLLLRLTEPGSVDPFYFGGGPRTEDSLDFRLWQLQADRLGIKLTDADVMREINAEAAGGKVLDPSKSFADQESVTAFLRPFGRDKSTFVMPADLMDALREEFRVVMAQGALLGSEPGVRSYRSELTTSATPSLATPDEFFDFYREQRTALRVKFFPISAESYLSQVKGEPTEAELRARFERGAKTEAMPFGRESGFKRPRRVKVEYVYASPEDAHYKKLAGEQLVSLRKLSEPKGRLSSAVAAILSPGLTGLPLAFDPLGRDFDDAAKEDFGWAGNPKDGVSEQDAQRLKRHATSIADPAAIASLVAGFQGGPVAALAGLDATSTAVEMRRMIPFDLGMLLSQSDPQNLFGAAALAAQTMPAATPRSLLEPQILAAKEKSLAENALRTNLETMATELRKLAKKPDEAKAYIAKAVQEYHLSLHGMPAARSPQDLLEELKDKKDKLDLDALRKGVLTDPSREPWTPATNTLLQSRQFVGYILQGNGTYQPVPVDRISDTKQDFLFWRTEDHKAEERTFTQVRAEVVASWRLDKARAMARDRAEKLVAEVNKKNGTPADAARFLKEQNLTSFELDKIVQSMPPEREVHFGMPTQYRPYQLPDDKADLMPYPPRDARVELVPFVKQLMKIPRAGDATVIVDSPAKTFYVALLVDRTEPSLADFRGVYVRSPGSDPLYMDLQRERREEYRRSVMEQLRRDAGAELDKEGRFKLPESLRKGDAGQFEES